jgi:hypothetical protein
VENKFSLTSNHEIEPNVWTTATNGDHDALAETPIAETATTASGADGNDENDEDQDDEHEYVNTKTDKNIESKRDKGNNDQKQLLNANHVIT